MHLILKSLPQLIQHFLSGRHLYVIAHFVSVVLFIAYHTLICAIESFLAIFALHFARFFAQSARHQHLGNVIIDGDFVRYLVKIIRTVRILAQLQKKLNDFSGALGRCKMQRSVTITIHYV